MGRPPYARKKSKTKNRGTVNMVCSRCDHRQEMERKKLYHAARARCSQCGGPLNRLWEK